MSSSCPSVDLLGRLGHDSLGASRFVAIEAHVESCPECQAMLERLAGDDSAGEAGGSPGRPPAIPGFVIERELGRGGMGVVYQAWQPQLDRRVAIKVVSGGPASGSGGRRLWLREARAIGRVRHRNVVRLHQAGEWDGWLYLVLDLIPGGSLADRSEGPAPPRAAAGLVEAIARAVEQIHDAGLLHLDIKPSNILLDGPPGAPWGDATPMLSDFGIALAGDDPGATATGPAGARGTPAYMAPEQITGDRRAIGPQADVFALGATLYTLLTGRSPFRAASAIETFDLIRAGDPTPPRALVPGLDRDLETIILTSLRTDPWRRYASAGELADELRRWLDGFPIRARPASKAERLGRWCRRRPAVSALLGILALTVASSIAGLLALWRDAEDQGERAREALVRAIEGEAAASQAAGDLVGLMVAAVDAPEMLASQRFTRSVQVVRDQAARLRRTPGVGEAELLAVCGLERRLAQFFIRQGAFAESRALIADSLELIEAHRGHRPDRRFDAAYARALLTLADVAHLESRFDEYLACSERIAASLEGRPWDPRDLDVFVELYLMRGDATVRGSHRSPEEARRRALEGNARDFARWHRRAGGDPSLGLLAALAEADLGGIDRAGEGLRSAIRRFPTDRRLPEGLEEAVASRIAGNVDPGPSPGGLDPEAQAGAILAAIGSRSAALGVHPATLPAVVTKLTYLASYTATEQRRLGRPDEARRTVAWLVALGRRLTSIGPEQAEYHLLLSRAFEQQAKNAWKAGDRPAIERSLRDALAEALVASRLDPRIEAARINVASLQDKLLGVVTGPSK